MENEKFPFDEIVQERKYEDPMGFPDTPWNRRIGEMNHKIISMDGEKDMQRDYIFKCFHELNDTFDDMHTEIVHWFNSQMQLTGNSAFVHMFDFSALYPASVLSPETMKMLLQHKKD